MINTLIYRFKNCRAKWRREEKLRTQRLSTPNNTSTTNNNNNNSLSVNNNNNNNNTEINCANDTNSSTETNPKVNVTNGSTGINSMVHNPHVASNSLSDSHSATNLIGDMHNPLLNGNHHLSTSSSLITSATNQSLSPPRFNFNHGFCSTMSPMYTPQMSISDSYR
jgi:hypothetical protein